MKCSNCHLENSDDAKFCLACHQEMPAAGGTARAAIARRGQESSTLYPIDSAIYSEDTSANPPSLTWVDATPRRGLIIASVLLLLALVAIAAYLFDNGSFASNELRLGAPWEDPAITLADMPPVDDFAEAPGPSAPSVAPTVPPAPAPAPAVPAAGQAAQQESEPPHKPDSVQKPEPPQKPESVQIPEPPQKPKPVQKPAPEQKPETVQKPELPQKPEPAQKLESSQKPQALSERVKKPLPKQKPVPVADTKPELRSSAAEPVRIRPAVRKTPAMAVPKTPEQANAARPVLRARQEDSAPAAVAPPVKAKAASWYRDLQAEMARCADGGNFFSRMICTEKAKFRFCGPGKHWGEVPECIQAQSRANY
jgi:hypothetical protein